MGNALCKILKINCPPQLKPLIDDGQQGGKRQTRKNRKKIKKTRRRN